jgi:hypothetical protein
MANLGVDDFKSQLTGGGARANLFKVDLSFPSYVTGVDGVKASLLVKNAQIPSSVVAPIMVPFRGRQLQIAGDRTFEPWNLTIINDTDFDARNAFESWMNGINQHRANTGKTTPGDYMADMEIHQLDRDGSILKTYKLRGTWPSNLGVIDLSYDSENTIEEFTVELQVTYWESDKTS